MKDFTLISNTKKLVLRIGEDFDSFIEKLKEFDSYSILPDEEMSTANIVFDDGFEIAFSKKSLGSVFLNINQDKPFLGVCSLLPENFFNEVDSKIFVDYLKESGFMLYEKKKYPDSIDMINSDIRVRYYSRPDNSYILIDSGSMLRS